MGGPLLRVARRRYDGRIPGNDQREDRCAPGRSPGNRSYTRRGAACHRRGAGALGETIGLAFQIHDDYLGIWGNPDLTGKSNTNDIARKKKTLPVIHGLLGPGGKAVREIYAHPELTEADISAVITALRESGADEFTREAAERQAAAAVAILDTIDLAAIQKDDLRAIGAYLIDRDA
ncbi:MAG: polyprenyl synthetase family protein [Dehalococcoidia bacterium]|nr:polyprenyl synthetase family protein [Dehalococcoidia bacterium]